MYGIIVIMLMNIFINEISEINEINEISEIN